MEPDPSRQGAASSTDPKGTTGQQASNGSGTPRAPARVPGKRTVAAIPAFNEGVPLGSVVLMARQYVDEVLVVDDGSSDDTAEVARLAGATVIVHKKNTGKGGAVKTIFDWARSNNVHGLVLLDGDMQHDPLEIPKLLEPVVNGEADMALGFRFGKNTEMPTWRRAGKRVLDYATAAGSDGQVTDSQCGFRAFGPKAIEKLNFNAKGFGVESEMIIKAQEHGLSWTEVSISCRYEGLDGSTQGPVRHATGVLMSVVRMIGELRPLFFLGIPGCVAFALGLFFGMKSIYTIDALGVLPVGTVVLAAMLMLMGLLTGLSALILHIIPETIARHLDDALPKIRLAATTSEPVQPARNEAVKAPEATASRPRS